MSALLLLLLLVRAPAPAPGVQDGAADASAPAVRMLPLKSGEVLWGTIESHDASGLGFRLLETGGLVPLAWSMLDPEAARELRLGFGYLAADVEEMLVDAERVTLSDGTELVGKVVNSDDEFLWLKRAEGTIPIDKRRLQGATLLVQAPALDVFTKDELYMRRASELEAALAQDGRPGAQAHDELARFAEQLFDFGHAIEHYEDARALDPTYDAQRIATAVERSRTKAEQKEQIDRLAEIDLWRVRGLYGKALAGLDAFGKQFPKSPLLDDWNALRARVLKNQEADLREAVVRSFHARSVRLARDVARRDDYENVLAYLDEGMAADLVKRVQQDVKALSPTVTPEDVQRFWRERKGGRVHQASYGLGTWLLGEGRALAVPPEPEPEKPAEKGGKPGDKASDKPGAKAATKPGDKPSDKPAPGSQAEARKKLEDRIQRYLKNQELARTARGGEGKDESEDPVVFWKDFDQDGRAQWILAYFAENGGLFQVDRIRFENCRECAGTGGREVINTGSAISGDVAGGVLVPCPTCHTLGRIRRVRYR